MPKFEHFAVRVTVSQPRFDINTSTVQEVSQSAMISFGQWLKGDKGEGIASVHTTDYWNHQVGYIPSEGEIVVYSDYFIKTTEAGQKYYPAVKIGTGTDCVQELVFLSQKETEELYAHITNKDIHVPRSVINDLVEEAHDRHYTYEWRSLQDTVAIQHNLHKKPSVTVVDTAGNELFCDVAYTDDDNLTLTFSCPIRGTAYLN